MSSHQNILIDFDLLHKNNNEYFVAYLSKVWVYGLNLV